MVTLPKQFMWLIPLRLAGFADLSSRAQISFIENVGFTLVVTPTIEQPLNSSGFDNGCRNLFFPIRRGRAPSFQQIDMFVAQVAKERMALVHSIEGNSRTGLFFAVWLLLFGFSSDPSLCAK